MSGAVRAVVFDFYGTLSPGRTDGEQAAARERQADALGVDAAALDAEMTATVAERFTGAGGSIEGSLAWVCARIGARPSPHQLAEAAAVRLAAERSFGRPRPEAVPVLTALRAAGMRIGMVSDCSAELPQYFPELEIAPLVDAAVFSFVVGVKKPAAAIFLACCTELAVEPADCLYVGDGGSNELVGAREVGMRAVHLAVPGESNGVVYGRHQAWDGEVIAALTDVPALLG
jgi:putative hydrolase of the HAD superfamily